MRLVLFFALPTFIAAIFRPRAGHFRNVLHKVKESTQGPPHGWVKRGRAPPDHLLQLKIALAQPHSLTIEKHLREVSNPSHERYGAYLSKEETETLMAPHPETLDIVSKWLSSHGIEEERLYRSSAKDWVTIHVPVSLAEEMLNTKYHVFTRSNSGESIVRTTSYSLPESLHEHVELIQPTTMFARLGPFKSTLHWSNKRSSDSSNLSSDTVTGPSGSQVDGSCNEAITIHCLCQLYNAVGYNTSATNGNRIAISEYATESVNDKDLQQFFQLQNPAAYGTNYTFVSVNGGINNQSYEATGMTANSDAQFAFGLTYPTPATVYLTGGLDLPPGATIQLVPYADWLDFTFSQEFLPQTITTGYSDDEQIFPRSYADRVCSGFATLGLRGVSVILSSGDFSVGDFNSNPANQRCLTNNGTNQPAFIPPFPASCPYVTSVGGTNHIPETAAPFSGGGFSNYFSRPDYQDIAVTNYLEQLVPGTYEGLYNPNGRAIPDVAAQASNFQIIFQGKEIHFSGTSNAAATFASIISMLNDARISAGMSPLGFLNPWLYQTGWAGLNDITEGNNPGCGTEGFNATEGWDAVTGLGTPDFESLLELVLGD